MRHYAGLDVSIKETSVCIIDESGKVCRETKVPSHPEDLARALHDRAWCLERVGLEAGPLSQWLFSGLAATGLPVVCIETRHAKAFLQAQVNKSDRNDARGIAQMMRVNLFRPVHVKTLTSQKRRALLTARKLLQEKALAVDNDIRGLLWNFGLKVEPIGASRFETRIRELVDGMSELAEIIDPLLEARRKLRELFAVLHRKLLVIVRDDTVCRAFDDGPRSRSGSIHGLHRHHRRSGPLQELQGCRGGPWIDPDPLSIRRKQTPRQG